LYFSFGERFWVFNQVSTSPATRDVGDNCAFFVPSAHMAVVCTSILPWWIGISMPVPTLRTQG
jgi:hypothetical protein